MELSKIYTVPNVAKDLGSAAPLRNIIADVVLLDKTQDTLQPMLYQLKMDRLTDITDFHSLQHDLLAMHRDAFMMVGEVESINRKEKQIILTNQNTVTYNHLIVASGARNFVSGTLNEDEFHAGLQTLLDALRVRSPANHAFAENTGEVTQPSKTLQCSAICATPPPKAIKTLARPNLSKDGAAGSTTDLSAYHKLYEVQV